MAEAEEPPILPLAYLVTSDSSIVYELEDNETSIGRADSCDIVSYNTILRNWSFRNSFTRYVPTLPNSTSLLSLLSLF
jgi:hypothetical protein